MMQEIEKKKEVLPKWNFIGRITGFEYIIEAQEDGQSLTKIKIPHTNRFRGNIKLSFLNLFIGQHLDYGIGGEGITFLIIGDRLSVIPELYVDLLDNVFFEFVVGRDKMKKLYENELNKIGKKK